MKNLSIILSFYWGFIFIAWYVLELMFLFLNPVDVFSITNSRYLLFNSFVPNKYFWDFACWISDIKKLLGYSLLHFWAMTFINMMGVTDHQGGYFSKDLLEYNLIQYFPRYLLKFPIISICFNFAIAILLGYLLCPAALGLDKAHSVWTIYNGAPGHSDPGFIAYRLSNPIFFIICFLHLIIGLQIVVINVIKNWKKRGTADRQWGIYTLRYIFAFCAILFLLQKYVLTIDGILFDSIVNNTYVLISIPIIIGFIILLLFGFLSDHKPFGATIKLNEILSLLTSAPLYTLISISFIIVPFVCCSFGYIRYNVQKSAGQVENLSNYIVAFEKHLNQIPEKGLTKNIIQINLNLINSTGSQKELIKAITKDGSNSFFKAKNTEKK